MVMVPLEDQPLAAALGASVALVAGVWAGNLEEGVDRPQTGSNRGGQAPTRSRQWLRRHLQQWLLDRAGQRPAAAMTAALEW